jgi:hypothetical protein
MAMIKKELSMGNAPFNNNTGNDSSYQNTHSDLDVHHRGEKFASSFGTDKIWNNVNHELRY